VPCGRGTVACEVVVTVAELDCEAPVLVVGGRLPLSLLPPCSLPVSLELLVELELGLALVAVMLKTLALLESLQLLLAGRGLRSRP
jgi:hypothetical protein